MIDPAAARAYGWRLRKSGASLAHWLVAAVETSPGVFEQAHCRDDRLLGILRDDYQTDDEALAPLVNFLSDRDGSSVVVVVIPLSGDLTANSYSLDSN